MSTNENMNRRPLFAAGSTASGETVIVIGLPQGAIDDMVADPGFGCPIDLSRAGIPLVITMFAAKDHEACKATILNIAEQLGIPAKLDTTRDFSIRDRRN